MSTQIKILDEDLNPLDNVEHVLSTYNWDFNRMADDELIVEVNGKAGRYNLFFIWQEEMQALQYCVQMDLRIPDNNRALTQQTLAALNENLWMGHFDLPKNTGKPSYRYTCLLRNGALPSAAGIIEDMVDISLAQCERHFPIFTMLAGANDICEKTMSLALMETAGES